MSENIFSQVDEESNILVLFHYIVDHRVDGKDKIQRDALIFKITKIIEGGRLPKTENIIHWKYVSTT